MYCSYLKLNKNQVTELKCELSGTESESDVTYSEFVLCI